MILFIINKQRIENESTRLADLRSAAICCDMSRESSTLLGSFGFTELQRKLSNPRFRELKFELFGKDAFATHR